VSQHRRPGAVPGLLAVLAAAAALSGCVSDGDAGIRLGADGCPLDPVLVEMDLEVANLVGGGRLGPTASRPYPIPLETGPAMPWPCVRSVVATIRWTNGPTAGADLYVGLDAPAAGFSAVGHDQQELFVDGAHEEDVAAPVAREQAPLLAQGVDLVVYSD
jgi:hypothetical protein